MIVLSSDDAVQRGVGNNPTRRTFGNPGEALSLQYHELKDETLYLLKGDYELTVDENGSLVQHAMREGDTYHIRPHTRHRMVAGPAGCDIVEVSTPELDDVVRLEDRYGRV